MKQPQMQSFGFGLAIGVVISICTSQVIPYFSPLRLYPVSPPSPSQPCAACPPSPPPPKPCAACPPCGDRLLPKLANRELDDSKVLNYSCKETYSSVKGEASSKLTSAAEFRTFITTKCSNPPTNVTTSLILSHLVKEKSYFLSVVENSLMAFARVIVIGEESELKLINKTGWYSRWFGKRFFVVVVTYREGDTYGEAMNKAVDMVTTPFVLIAPRMTYTNFDIIGQQLDVQRLIRVLETVDEADVVGGATKDVSTGHWSRGCYQTRAKMYTLKYTYGYQRSTHECLFCNHLSSPFLARPSFLRTFKFPKDNHGIIRDFFYKINQYRKNALSCPDVMFYTSPMTESDSELKKFAERWNIGQIIEANNVKRKLLYFHEGPTDKRPYDTSKCNLRTKSLAVHPGCRYNLLQFLDYACKSLSKAGITYETSAGTTIGALKFDNILPWDIDADLNVIGSPKKSTREHQKEVMSKVAPIWRKDGVGVQNDPGSHNINLVKDGWTIELYFYQDSRQGPYTVPRTLVNIGGKWLDSVENPGLRMRTRYGMEIYRHVEHWRQSKSRKSHSFHPYIAGKFPECTKAGHQGCLDQFEADGSLQFAELF